MNDFLVVLLRDNWLQLATGLLLPLAVGFVTKLDSHPAFQALANFLLSLAAGVLEAILANGGVFDPEQIIAYVAAIFGVSHVAYKAIWKPMGGGVADPVRLATPEVGVSGPPAPTVQAA